MLIHSTQEIRLCPLGSQETQQLLVAFREQTADHRPFSGGPLPLVLLPDLHHQVRQEKQRQLSARKRHELRFHLLGKPPQLLESLTACLTVLPVSAAGGGEGFLRPLTLLLGALQLGFERCPLGVKQTPLALPLADLPFRLLQL